MSDDTCFLGTCAAGYDRLWEVALITPDGAEHVWQFVVDELAVDAGLVAASGFWDRRWQPDTSLGVDAGVVRGESAVTRATWYAHLDEARNVDGAGRAIAPGVKWCQHFRALTADCRLVGVDIGAGAETIGRLLRTNGLLPRWAETCDIATLAAGWLAGLALSHSIDQTSVFVEVHEAKLDAAGRTDDSTALGSAKKAKAIYDVVIRP